MIYGVIFVLFCFEGGQSDLQTVNINSSKYKNDFNWEKTYQEGNTYRFEDFFWTGSGDEPLTEPENPWVLQTPNTVFETKTIISTSTIFFTTSAPSNNATQEPKTKCIINCEEPRTIENGTITPTATFPTEKVIPNDEENFIEADRQFWLLTVLKSDGKDPVILNLTNSLATLYKKAFQRQQNRHLGIAARKKRNEVPPDKKVKVYIHNVNKQKLNKDEKIEVLYHVAVSGKPVIASTAAEDMRFVSDEEVQQTLGYPFVIKAEPYLKAEPPQSLRKYQNTWLVIGSTTLALLLFLLILAFIILGFTKYKKSSTLNGAENRQHIFERGVGLDNKGFEPSGSLKLERKHSPTYVNYQKDSICTQGVTVRTGSSFSTSSCSSTSLDISPLMTIKKPPRKTPRPKGTQNKTVPINVRRIPPELFDSDTSRDTPDTIFLSKYDPGVVSPKSYLSMPSVKSFPRSNIPEPLSKVLEPVSVQHLDLPDDEQMERNIGKVRPKLVRHGSFETEKDPGVIGPIVWNIHLKNIQQEGSLDEIDYSKSGTNVTKMRKRLHDLLDDTFSLFGSRRASPEALPKPQNLDIKSHSAAPVRPNDEDDIHFFMRPRPKTSEPRKQASPSKPRGAWSSNSPSHLVRPMSAGPICPRVNIDQILAEGAFLPNDPAIPLIAAIKSEIQKCSLPGSTADLTKD